jgi:hypothetical protein
MTIRTLPITPRERFQRALARIDRQLQKPELSKEQRRELWPRRQELCERQDDAGQ